MTATRTDVDRWIKEGQEMGASHIISVCDTFNYDDFPVFVMPGENLEERKAEYVGNLQRINEVIQLVPEVKEDIRP